MKKKYRGLVVCAAAFCALTMGSELHAQVALRVSGSTTVQPAAELVAEIFARLYSGSADVQGGGSGAGIRGVQNGTADIGMASRALTAEESVDLEAITYGFDALVFIVNRANPLEELRLSDVRQIYSGATTNWQPLSGWDNDIVVINKEIGRATLDLFEGYSGVSHQDRAEAGESGRVTAEAYEIASNFEALTLVGGIPGAVGYVSMGAAERLADAGMPIKVLRLDGVAASAETLGNGSYPILRELNLVVREETELTRLFTDLFFEPELRSYIEASGVVPAER